MVDRIIWCLCCFLCGFPFLIISICNRKSSEPISFWSGDQTLKSKVKNVKEYNEGMAVLYKKCFICLGITGAAFLVMPVAGIMMLCFDFTIGIYLTYRNYKKLLRLYS